jgi:pyruvate dehydrogenase E1 component beta subunit
VGGEILAELVERGFDFLEGRPIRVAGLDVPIPYNRSLERLVIPDSQKIIDAVHRAID